MRQCHNDRHLARSRAALLQAAVGKGAALNCLATCKSGGSEGGIRGIDRRVLRTGCVRAQPDAIADCWAYAVAHTEPNTGAYARPDAVADS